MQVSYSGTKVLPTVPPRFPLGPKVPRQGLCFAQRIHQGEFLILFWPISNSTDVQLAP